MYFVYILRTLDNSLYVGVTENVDERIATHNGGKGPNGPEPIAALG